MYFYVFFLLKLSKEMAYKVCSIAIGFIAIVKTQEDLILLVDIHLIFRSMVEKKMFFYLENYILRFSHRCCCLYPANRAEKRINKREDLSIEKKTPINAK